MAIEWFATRDAAARRFDQLRFRAHETQLAVYRERGLTGWCPICRQIRKFTVPAHADGGWASLREELVCECGMNSRMRMIFAAIEECPPRGRFLMLERVTPLFAKIQDRYPFVEGCEYFGEDVESGSVHNIHGLDVRHENLLGLSFGDRSFDFIFHGDVLEHVPDIRRALSECYRVLNRGGTLVFTCPMYNFNDHIVRATVTDGKLTHLLPPAYHGNPVDEKGALVFTEPSLTLLEDMRAVGFDVVEIGLAFDPSLGILRDGNPYEEYNAWPVIFRAVRGRKWFPSLK